MKRALLMSLLLAVSAVHADEGPTVLDAVFSKMQAQRGKSVYNKQCIGCHSNNLQGEGIEPPLIGELFVDAWREDKLFSLYDFIATRMPKEGRDRTPGSLTEQQYLDVLAYVLERNGYPAGTQELKGPQLTTTQFVGLNGAAPLPQSAMVRFVGCLQGEGDSFHLEQATAATRVRVSDETDEHETSQSREATLGDAQVNLTNVAQLTATSPASMLQQKVQAKGVLNLDNGAVSLHVLSLVTTGVVCAPRS